MKIGDKVKHKEKGWIGTITQIDKRGHPMVNLNDEWGVLFRWVHRDSVEVVNEGGCFAQERKLR